MELIFNASSEEVQYFSVWNMPSTQIFYSSADTVQREAVSTMEALITLNKLLQHGSKEHTREEFLEGIAVMLEKAVTYFPETLYVPQLAKWAKGGNGMNKKPDIHVQKWPRVHFEPLSVIEKKERKANRAEREKREETARVEVRKEGMERKTSTGGTRSSIPTQQH